MPLMMDHFHFIPQRNLQMRELLCILLPRDVFCGLCVSVTQGPERDFSRLPSAGSSSSVLGLQRAFDGAPEQQLSLIWRLCSLSERKNLCMKRILAGCGWVICWGRSPVMLCGDCAVQHHLRWAGERADSKVTKLFQRLSCIEISTVIF